MKTNSARTLRFSVRCFLFSVLLLCLALANSAFAAVRYVHVNSANPAPPYTNWTNAARTIQDAVDAAVAGDEIVVTNGVYASGGRAVGTNLLVNRVAVDKPLTVRSVNGPQFTIIQGYQVPGTTNGDRAIRCAYLADGASLSGFTLTNGATRSVEDHGPYDPGPDSAGGGAWAESASAMISNCVVAGNSSHLSGGGVWNGTLKNCEIVGNWAGVWGGGTAKATLSNCSLRGNSAQSGGGAWNGILDNCLLTGNTAHGDFGWGGGAYGDFFELRLNNCTLAGNSAHWGGGVAAGDYGQAFLTNCIIYFNTNTAKELGNYYGYGCVLNYCSTTPQPELRQGIGNITNATLFVDYAGGNLRLQSNSPCINAGLNTFALGSTDPDGNPRIVSGTVDIGAYEFQGTGSVISYAWLHQYGLPIDGSADYLDLDGDGRNTWQEWRCQTDPANALSVLRLLSASSDGTNVTISWQSVAGVNYFLDRSTNLAAPSPFLPLATDIAGQAGTTTYKHSDVDVAPCRFYRVGVKK